ncbi:LIC_13387 family protein [Thalassotalea fusca]
MISQVLLIIGASIFGMLGFVHLFYTFFTNKFNPFKSDVIAEMSSTSPVLTKETTIWRAWVGFNASHSLGAIFFAAIYIPLAFSHFQFFANNNWFVVLPPIVGFSYLFLAKSYWFKVPFWGILLSTLCFVGALLLIKT